MMCQSSRRKLFAAYGQDYAALKRRIREIEARLMDWHKRNELSQRLVEAPGIGPIGASLLVMKVPDPHAFRSGRDFGLDRLDTEGPLHRRQNAARRITRAGDEDRLNRHPPDLDTSSQ